MAGDGMKQFPVVGRTVLHLVDHDVVKLFGPVFPRFVGMVEDIDCEEEEVVVVEGEKLLLEFDVSDGSILRLVGGMWQKMVLDIFYGVITLVCRHLLQETFGCGLSAVDAEFLHCLAGESLSVFLIHDGEVAWISYSENLFPQKFGTEAMDGANEVVDASTVHHRRDAPFHFLRCLVGEGQAKDIARADSDFICEIGIAMCEDPGFPRSRSGHDTDSPFGGLYSFELVLLSSYATCMFLNIAGSSIPIYQCHGRSGYAFPAPGEAKSLGCGCFHGDDIDIYIHDLG